MPEAAVGSISQGNMSTIVHTLELAGGSAARGTRRGPTVRVALASQDGKALNAHFGSARRLMVYDVTARAHGLVKVLRFVSDGPDDRQEEDKITPKLSALAGCHILCALAIGPPAAARVIQANIHPIRVGTAEPIETAIARVQAMMSVEPPSWLKRILLDS
jgi:nitrogen fixation protein NifX